MGEKLRYARSLRPCSCVINCAIINQNTLNGHYNIERISVLCLQKGAKVKICGSCEEARGLKNVPLLKCTEMSTMTELAQWVVDSDKALTF